MLIIFIDELMKIINIFAKILRYQEIQNKPGRLKV